MQAVSKIGVFLAAALLASCSREAEAPVKAAPAAAPVAAAPVTPQAPAVAVRPEGADAVDAALAGVQAFNAKILSDLASIETSQARIRDQAAKAADAARRGDAARVTAARSDAETTHGRLAAGLAAFRTAAAEQQAAVTAATALCTPPLPAAGAPVGAAPVTAAPAPGLTTYAGCATLATEQALMAQNIEAMAARHQAAESAYRQDRTRLEEAAATVALGRINPL
jgi:hypothetical protein